MGADELLPILCFVVVKSGIANLHSHLYYLVGGGWRQAALPASLVC